MINFDSGSKLADFQEACYNKLLNKQTLSSKEIDQLKGNQWVNLAKTLAPSNLVIRHFCLLDIIENSTKHLREIIEQIKKLTYDENKEEKLLWAEGYSYWLYTKKFLKLYNKFPILHIIDMIDLGFQKTSYIRGNILYPAPFGDLRDIPLEEHLQSYINYNGVINYYRMKVVTPVLRIIDKDGTVQYFIKGIPVSLNAHIQKKDTLIEIKDGIPVNFKFYHDEGNRSAYQVKYPNKIKEFTDVLDPKRILSLF